MAVAEAEALTPLPPDLTIEVLVETLQVGQVAVAPSVVVARLAARGVPVSTERVQELFARYGLDAGKKTAAPVSPPSRH